MIFTTLGISQWKVLIILIIDKVDEYIEEGNGNKCLILASTDKNKEVLRKCTELWDGIKCLIKTINGGLAGEYEKE